MKKAFIIGVSLVLAVALFAAMIISQITATLFAADKKLNNSDNDGQIMIPITITGTAKGSNVDLTVAGDGINISGIKGTLSNNSFSAKNKTKNGNITMELPGSPAKLNMFSWMPQFDQSLYSYHLDHSSPQYKFNQSCSNDDQGFRKSSGAYLIALGSYYGSTIGQKYILKFKQKDGSTISINAVLGDQKSDSHTDKTNRYHLTDGSVVEFIMAGRSDNNSSVINKKFGTLTSISKGGSQCNLNGKIENGKINITGDIDGVPLTASGTVKSGKVHATGFYGNASLAFGNGTSDFGKAVLNEAVKYQGYPYVFGGTPPSSFDCSALTMWCYGTAGISLPRTAQGQYDKVKHISLKKAKVGDLVFFTKTYNAGRYITHVGLYAGNGKMFHAGSPLGYTDLSSNYWQSHLVCAGTIQ